MKKYFPLIGIVLIIFVGIFIYKASNNKPPVVETPKEVIKLPVRYTFENLGITLEVDQFLDVIKNPTVDLEDNTKLESYLFYIQRRNGTQGEGTPDFQMYGIYQYTLPYITTEDFANIKKDPTYAYMNDFNIQSMQGLEGRLTGERSNYVYFFNLGQRTLRIAVSPATDENKALADKILKTMQTYQEPSENL